MCDTVAIIGKEQVFFAKNSDRDPNEAQFLEWHPRRQHPADSTVTCTWITIPQVRETRRVLLSRPFWMWGAEMGANEDGLVIGNEAVFTDQPYSKTGLTGMDLLRLALERTSSAETACELIIELLETHGQGGGCGYENRQFTYHNSFIVADRNSGYVLETAGEEWACEAIQEFAAISNGLTLNGFAQKHREWLKTTVSACTLRRARTLEHLKSAETVGDLFTLLRNHGPRYPQYTLLNGGMGAPCMHAGGIIAAAQTTASWVSELRAGGDRHWVTATAAPCTSLFKPASLSAPPDLGTFPSDVADDGLWWQHERFHRQVMKDPENAFPVFEQERNALEKAWLSVSPDPVTAFRTHADLLYKWRTHPVIESLQDKRPRFVRAYWQKRNRQCGLF